MFSMKKQFLYILDSLRVNLDNFHISLTWFIAFIYDNESNGIRNSSVDNEMLQLLYRH